MKTLFIYMGGESLGVEYLAAGARAAGHEVDLAFDPAVFGGHQIWEIPALAGISDKRPAIIRKILRERPDVVALSCVTANYQWFLTLAKEIKKQAPQVRTVFGGPHVMGAPRRVIAEPSVDALITGEADDSFPALLSAWENGADEITPGVWKKRDGKVVEWAGPHPVADIEKLPFPDKEIFFRKVPVFERHYTIMASRGCPYNCFYCCKIPAEMLPPGVRAVRRRSVDNVIAELEKAVRGGRVRLVKFFDDVFTLNRNWMEEFTPRYKEKIHLPYFCFSHPAALDAHKADLLRESGCIFVTVGVQCVDEAQRREYTGRRYSNEQVLEAVAHLKQRGMMVSIDHIVGLPGDDGEKIRAAANFYNGLRPHRLFAYWLNYFPGAKLMEMARVSGDLSEEEIEKIENGKAGRHFGRGGMFRDNGEFGKAVAFFPLIPLLPRGMVDFILRKNLFKWMPGSGLMCYLMILFNSIKTRDPFFFFNLSYIFSRKKSP